MAATITEAGSSKHGEATFADWTIDSIRPGQIPSDPASSMSSQPTQHLDNHPPRPYRATMTA